MHKICTGENREKIFEKKVGKNNFLKIKFYYLGDFRQDLLFMYGGVFFTFESLPLPLDFAGIMLSPPEIFPKKPP